MGDYFCKHCLVYGWSSMAEESRAAPFHFRKIRAKPMPALAWYPEMHYNEKMGFYHEKERSVQKNDSDRNSKIKAGCRQRQ